MASSSSMSPERQRLVIVGGISEDVKTQDKCRIQCKRGKKWQVLTKLPEKLSAFSICQTEDGFIISGGRNSNYEDVSTCYQFVASTQDWKRLPDLLTARFGTASIMIEGCVYIIGGAEWQGDAGMSINCCESLSLHGNVWNKHMPMLQGMVYPIAVTINGFVFVLFNDLYLNEANKYGDTVTLQIYNTLINEWSYGEALPEDIASTVGASAVAINDSILVAGGQDRICVQYLPNTNSWSKINRPLLEHECGSMIVHVDKVLLLGGKCYSEVEEKVTKLVEEYEPQTQTWKVSDVKLPGGLWMHHAILLNNVAEEKSCCVM